jgi:hypothetical protein
MKATSIEYMTAILTAESGDTEKIAEIITESMKLYSSTDIMQAGDLLLSMWKVHKKTFRFIYQNSTLISRMPSTEREKMVNTFSLTSSCASKNLNKKSFESRRRHGCTSRAADDCNTEEAIEYNKAQGQEMRQESLLE